MLKHTISLFAVTMLATVQAHLFISSPSPIPGSAPKDPLLGTGSDFPCHGVSLPGSNTPTSMAAGSSQSLIFDGGVGGVNTATHGGGSCQISITYETDATKVKDASNWFVIYSIEGGCPTNSLANLDGPFPNSKQGYGAFQCSNSTTDGVNCLNAFEFTIPNGVNTGAATLAWTWFNNVGNREMYMNWVNVDLTGGDGSEMDDFPTMFVADLTGVGSQPECTNPASTNIAFPYPGKYTTTKTAANGASNYPTATPAGCANIGAPQANAVVNKPSASATSTSAMSSALLSSAISSAPAASSNQIPSSAVSSLSSTSTVAYAISTAYVVQTITASSTVSQAAPASSSAAPFSAASSSSQSTGATSGSCPSGTVACSSVGSVMCIGSGQFGLCDINTCAVPQELASGTTCSGDVITKRSDEKVDVRMMPVIWQA